METPSTSNSDSLEVFVVTIQEYYYIPKFLRQILEAEQIDVLEIATMPPTLGTKNMPRFVADLLQRFGPRVFAKHGYFYVKYALLDVLNRYASRGNAYSSRTLARRYDVDHRHVTDVNDSAFVAHVAERDPDVLVSVAATQKFDPALLAVPSECAINVHSSLLPEYRGVSPSFWVLLNDEDSTGISVHYMDEDIDTGDVLVQEELPIKEDDTLHSLNTRIAERGADALLTALEQIRHGTVDPTPIDPTSGSYYSLPTRADVAEFVANERRFY